VSAARVVAIQSQVVHGHVGNAAALPALAALGVAAAGVPTTLLSNHPAYPTVRGRALEGAEVAALLAGAAERGLAAGAAVIVSGYLGRAETGAAVAEFVARARAANPGVRYICDPVAGDDGRFFVDEAVRAALARLVPRADIVTPNRFELGWLAGRAVEDRAGAIGAARALGRPGVAVTGCVWAGGTVETLWVEPGAAWAVTTPLIPTRAHGMGDLFAALLAGRIARGEAAPAAVAAAASGVTAVLRATPAEADEMALTAASPLLDDPPERFPAEPA
jgi:pyridoxine kinase